MLGTFAIDERSLMKAKTVENKTDEKTEQQTRQRKDSFRPLDERKQYERELDVSLSIMCVREREEERVTGAFSQTDKGTSTLPLPEVKTTQTQRPENAKHAQEERRHVVDEE